MNGGNETAKTNRARKLFWLLVGRYRKGCIVSQLELEFPEDCYRLGLVPHVLACINTYSAYGPKQECLSVLFVLVRNWETPAIYQFHKTRKEC